MLTFQCNLMSFYFIYYHSRIVMRHEHSLSICLNYSVTSEMKYKPKDDETWHITINDYSEGESCEQNFCFKFPNEKQALQFKIALDKASNLSSQQFIDRKESDTDDVVFVGEVLASNEEQQKAIELKLPENFYTYKNKPPCQGCRGCNDDEDINNEATTNQTVLSVPNSTINISEIKISTPVKTSIQSIQSPSSSLYGTPGGFNETANCSYFGTPLGSQGYNTKSPFVSNNKNDDKENTLTETSNSLADFSEQKLKFGTTNNQSNIFSSQQSTIIKKPILSAPKLDSLNSNVSTETKTLSNDNKNIFVAPGVSSNNSIFGFSSVKNSDVQQTSEIKSLFGGDEKPVNLFSGTPGSIFGLSALKVDSTKSSGLNFGSQNKSLVENMSNFGKIPTNEPATESSKLENKSSQSESTVLSISKDVGLKGSEKLNQVEAPLKVDNSLSFEALSMSGSGFNIESKI